MDKGLAAGKYLLLTSFRKDGTPVPTPVWVMGHDGLLFVYSAPDAGKVKRIRRNGAVTVGPCTVRGTPTGPSVAGTARILPESEAGRVRTMMMRKYWVLGPLTALGGRIRRGRMLGAAIEITVSE